MATPSPQRCTGWNYNRCGQDGFAFIDPNDNTDEAIDRALRRFPGRPITIFLGDKPITITKPIVLGERQWLVGSPCGTEIKVDAGIIGSAIALTGHYSGVANVRLISGVHGQGIGIHVNGGDGSVIAGIGNFQIENTYCMGFDAGIKLQCCWVGRIQHCTAEGCRAGLELGAGFVNAINILGGAYGGNAVGILFSPTTSAHNGVSIDGVTIEANHQSGIELLSEDVSVKIRNGYFERNGYAVMVNSLGCRGLVMDGNFFANSPAIQIAKAKSAMFQNNTFQDQNPVTIEAGAEKTVVGQNNYYSHANYYMDPNWEGNNLSQSTQFTQVI